MLTTTGNSIFSHSDVLTHGTTLSVPFDGTMESTCADFALELIHDPASGTYYNAKQTTTCLAGTGWDNEALAGHNCIDGECDPQVKMEKATY